MLTIALLGHDLHNDNLGVGALTVSGIRILREIAARQGLAIRILVINGGGARPACAAGSDIEERVVRPLARPWQLARTLRESDLVIDISGGDSFADIYGSRRIAIIFLQKYLAHLLRRPVVMAPQTVGPFTGRLWRALARGTLGASAVVATRDDPSTAFVRDLGVRREVIDASDVALRLPFDAPAKRAAGPVRVGLNVSGLLMQGGYTGNNMFGLRADYPALVRRLIAGFMAHEAGCEVHLIGHVMAWQGAGREDDHAACRALAGEFPGCILAPAFATPSEAKTYIAGLGFFAGARMHACIAAFSAGVPVVPMAYSRKFAGLFGSLGYPHTVDCTTESAADIAARIFAAFIRRDELAREIAAAHGRGLDRLDSYERALEALMLRLAEQRNTAPKATPGAAPAGATDR